MSALGTQRNFTPTFPLGALAACDEQQVGLLEFVIMHQGLTIKLYGLLLFSGNEC